VAGRGADRPSCTRTRLTTTAACAATYAAAASPPGSPASASTPASGSADTAASSNAPWAWLLAFRRLALPYDRTARTVTALATLACALICHRRLR